MFEFLFRINWHEQETAYGRATEVPDQLLRLNSPIPTVRKLAQWELYGNLYHQGTIYPGAAFAIPFLVELQKDGENADKAWIDNYINDLCYFESEKESEDEEGDFEKKDKNNNQDGELLRPGMKAIEKHVAIHKLCLKIYNHGYSEDTFQQIQSLLAQNTNAGFKTYDIPDLNKYKIGYMGESRDEANAKIAEFKAQGHWDIILEDRMYPGQYVVFIPKSAPKPKPIEASLPKILPNQSIPDLVKEAGKLFSTKNYSGSAILFKRILELDPKNPMAYHFIIESYLSLQKPLEALPYADNMVRLFGEIPGSQVDYGRVQLVVNRKWLGIQAFEKALSMLPVNDPMLHGWSAIPAFQIADFERAYQHMHAVILDNKRIPHDPQIEAFYPIVALMFDKKDEILTYFRSILNLLHKPGEKQFSDYIKLMTQLTASLGLHFQNAGLWKITPDILYGDLQQYLVQNLAAADDRTDILEMIYFLDQMIYGKKTIQLPEFQTTEGFLQMMDAFLGRSINYWEEINRYGWTGLLKTRPDNKLLVIYDSRKLGEFLQQLGEKKKDQKIRCFGMDIIAACLEQSPLKEDWMKAKSILEEIQGISKDYYSPATYESIVKKLNS